MRCVRCGLPMSTCCAAAVLPSAAASPPALALCRALSASSQAKGRSSTEMPMDPKAAALTAANAEPTALLDDDGNNGVWLYAAPAPVAGSCRPIGIGTFLLSMLILLVNTLLGAAALR